jgi:metal-responsive CopG/Arc/MetJ family transcriptional regulator
MAKLGRPALLIPTTEWKVRVPVDLAAKADLLHLDPIRGNLKYGARSELITILLREYLDKLGKDGDDKHSINSPENPNV